jgi:hypothetical protein
VQRPLSYQVIESGARRPDASSNSGYIAVDTVAVQSRDGIACSEEDSVDGGLGHVARATGLPVIRCERIDVYNYDSISTGGLVRLLSGQFNVGVQVGFETAKFNYLRSVKA